MKKSFVLAGMISISMFLSACSSESNSGSKSLAEKCEKGVTESCLEGATWSMNAFYTIDEGNTAYSVVKELKSGGVASPSTLTFEEDGSFTLINSRSLYLNSEGTCLGEEEAGTWSVSGGQLTMNFTMGCMLGSMGYSFTSTPTIIDLNGSTALNLGGSYIYKDAPIAGYNLYEVFTGVER